MKIKYQPSISRSAFMRLGKKRRRVLIAEDIIQRINAKMLVGEVGAMFAGSDGDATKEYVNTRQCTVCAKGAIACAWLGNLNKHHSLEAFEVDADISMHPGTDEVVETFSRDLWDAIECAFEHGAFEWHTSLVHDHMQEIVDTFIRFTNETNRIKAIMQNIVDNGGRLLLKDGTIIG